jgi:hypothetical protein
MQASDRLRCVHTTGRKTWPRLLAHMLACAHACRTNTACMQATKCCEPLPRAWYRLPSDAQTAVIAAVTPPRPVFMHKAHLSNMHMACETRNECLTTSLLVPTMQVAALTSRSPAGHSCTCNPPRSMSAHTSPPDGMRSRLGHQGSPADSQSAPCAPADWSAPKASLRQHHRKGIVPAWLSASRQHMPLGPSCTRHQHSFPPHMHCPHGLWRYSPGQTFTVHNTPGAILMLIRKAIRLAS